MTSQYNNQKLYNCTASFEYTEIIYTFSYEAVSVYISVVMECWLPVISGDVVPSAFCLFVDSFFLNGRDKVKLPRRWGNTSPTNTFHNIMNI